MQHKKLKEIADVFTGARLGRFSKKTSNALQEQTVIKKIYSNNNIEYETKEISIELDNKFYTRQGDILIQLAGENTIVKIDQEGLIVSMFYCVIRAKQGYDSNYIYHVLKNEILPKYQNILNEGSALQTIKTIYLKELKIPVIDQEKQIKLGELLYLINIKKDLHEKLSEIDEKMINAILNNYMKEDD